MFSDGSFSFPHENITNIKVTIRICADFNLIVFND